jgi:hypothetical protein
MGSVTRSSIGVERTTGSGADARAGSGAEASANALIVPRAMSSAWLTALIVCGRPAGCFASMRAISSASPIGRPGTISRGCGGRTWR